MDGMVCAPYVHHMHTPLIHVLVHQPNFTALAIELLLYDVSQQFMHYYVIAKHKTLFRYCVVESRSHSGGRTKVWSICVLPICHRVSSQTHSVHVLTLSLHPASVLALLLDLIG